MDDDDSALMRLWSTLSSKYIYCITGFMVNYGISNTNVLEIP